MCTTVQWPKVAKTIVEKNALMKQFETFGEETIWRSFFSPDHLRRFINPACCCTIAMPCTTVIWSERTEEKPNNCSLCVQKCRWTDNLRKHMMWRWWRHSKEGTVLPSKHLKLALHGYCCWMRSGEKTFNCNYVSNCSIFQEARICGPKSLRWKIHILEAGMES